MCGIFGFVGAERNAGTLLKNLKRMARVNESRGAHSFGFAWIDSRDRLRHYRQPGPISRNLETLDRVADAKMFIGHCRYVTQGDPGHNINNHPHPSDGGWIVHNGSVHAYEKIADGYDLPLTSDCDSEVIGALIEQLDGDLKTRVQKAVNLCSRTDFSFMGIWPRPNRLVVVRAGKPLFYGLRRGGFGQYFSSCRSGLPGHVHQCSNNYGEVLELNRVDQLYGSCIAIQRPAPVRTARPLLWR